MATNATDIPRRLRELAERLPSSTTVREHLNDSRREVAFLRKLLRLALDSEAVGKGGPQ
jgi:hypothetical protein